jgi:hypothetical protein
MFTGDQMICTTEKYERCLFNIYHDMYYEAAQTEAIYTKFNLENRA